MNQQAGADDLAARALRLAARLQSDLRGDPGRPLPWVQLAEALFVAQRFAQGLRAAEQAIALDPELAVAHAIRARTLRRLDRPGEAVEAWNLALAREPDRSDYHSGLGAALVAAGDRARAYRSFEHAVALAPADARLRRDLALLYVQHAESARVRELLAHAAAQATLPESFRQEAGTGVAVLDEHARLRAPLEAALAEGDPERLRPALLQAPAELLGEDDLLLGRLRAMAMTRIGPLPARPRWDQAAASGLEWPVIEGHFETHLGDSVEAVVASWRMAGDAAAQAGAGVDVAGLRAARCAVEWRQRLGVLGDDAIGFEARLRLYHARMNAHLPEAFAGQFKIMPNRVHGNVAEGRGAPQHVAGTLRAYRSQIRPALQDPRVAAALAIYLMAKLHPCSDGNGGLGRFVASGELSLSELGPLIVPDRLHEPLNRAIRHVHRTDEIGAIVGLIDACLRWRDDFVGELQRRGLRPR